jgi:cytochrome c-type biogenesis protein CcmH/NrfG
MMTRALLARSLCLPLALWCGVAWSQSSASADASGSAASAHDAADRCHSRHATVDACDDAVRYNPRDPSLLIAMGDAQIRAKRPGDAVRAYQRAAALAPSNTGIQQKLAKAEAIIAKSKSSAGHGPLAASTANKRFSNSDPESQSH